MNNRKLDDADTSIESRVTRRKFLGGTVAVAAAGLLGPVVRQEARAQTMTFAYFISPTGSDSNNGLFPTQGAGNNGPWAITSLANIYTPGYNDAVQGAHQRLMAGKAIGLVAGTYNVYSLINNSGWNSSGGAAPYFLLPSGTAGNPTILASCDTNGNYSARAATIEGRSGGTTYPTNQTAILGQNQVLTTNGVQQNGYVTIDGVNVFGSNIHNLMFFYGTFDNQGSTIPSFPQVTVRNCEIAYCFTTSAGNNPGLIGLWGTDAALIQNNKLHYCYGDQSRNEGAAVMSYACQNNVYEYNTVYDQAQGFFDKYVNQKAVTIRYNFVDLSSTMAIAYGSGALMDETSGAPGFPNHIYNNIFISCTPWFGLYFAGSTPAQPTRIVYNNTFVVCGPSGEMTFLDAVLEASNGLLTFYNNILANPQNVKSSTGAAFFSTGQTIDYNLYPASVASSSQLGAAAPSSGSEPSPTLYTWANWKSQLGYDTHGIAANPTFVSGVFVGNGSSLNPAGWQLASGSPGKGAGSTTGTASGAATDMGAWGNGAIRIGCDFGVPPSPPNPVSVT